jgi:hypothetical protein
MPKGMAYKKTIIIIIITMSNTVVLMIRMCHSAVHLPAQLSSAGLHLLARTAAHLWQR